MMSIYPYLILLLWLKYCNHCYAVAIINNALLFYTQVKQCLSGLFYCKINENSRFEKIDVESLKFC